MYWGGTNTSDIEIRASISPTSPTASTPTVIRGPSFRARLQSCTPAMTAASGAASRLGATWTGTGAGPATINAGGLQTGLLYHMDIKRDATAASRSAHFQDNGNNKWTGAPGWINHLGGDGLNTIFDLQNVATAYAIDNGGPNISTDSGSTWADITNNIPTDAHTITRYRHSQNAITVDPNTAGILYLVAPQTDLPPPAPPTHSRTAVSEQELRNNLGTDNQLHSVFECRSFCSRACEFQQPGSHRRQLALHQRQRFGRDTKLSL